MVGGALWACPGAKKKSEKEKKDKAAKAKAKAAKASEGKKKEDPEAEQQCGDDWWDEWDEYENDDGEWWELEDVPPYEGCNSGFPGEGVGS